MATVIRKFLGFALIALVPATTLAQDQSAEMNEAIGNFERMVEEVGKLAGDARFDEGDVRSLLDLWDEFSAFESNDHEDDTLDFDAILTDSEYRSWAASHNLDADDWMRKTVRITMAIYREQMLAAAEMMPGQVAQQLEMIEQQREALGEEMYREIRQGMQAAAAYGEAMMENTRRLPEPTAAEQAILEKYREELMAIMDTGDEDAGYDGYDDEDFEDDDRY